MNDLRLKLRVDKLQLHLTMAADDPCDLAINYGRMNASLAGLIAQLERFLVIKKRDVHIDCDFTASQTVIIARLDLTITLGRILYIAVLYGIRALTTFLKIKKRDIQVCCDFIQPQTTIYVRADITITLGRLLGLLLRYGWRALREYLKIFNKQKGGAVK